MADLKISELGSIPAVASADVLAIVDTSLSETNKVSVEDLLRGAPSGTAAAPSIAFVDDPDTGIFKSGTNELAISTGGTQRVVVDSSGSVGIGTTSPDGLLTVQSASGNSQLYIKTSNTVSRSQLIFGDSADSNVGGITYYHTDDSMQFHVGNGGERMRIDSSGNVSIDAADGKLSLTKTGLRQYQLRVTGSGTSDGLAIRDESGATEIARFTRSGNVGIGTTSPVRELQLGDNTSSAEVISLQTSTAGNGSIYFGDNTADSREYRGMLRYSHSDDAMLFWTSSTERMRVDSAGRLLVGTTTSRAGYFNSSSSYGGKFQLEGANSNTDRTLSFVYGDDSTGDPILVLAKHRSTSTGIATSSLTSVNSGDGLGMISFQGKAGSKFVEGARVQALVDATPGTNDLPAYLRFSTTADGAGGSTERVRIDSLGRVLIGKTAVSSTSTGIQIEPGSTGYAFITNNTSNTGARPLILNRQGGDGQMIQFRVANSTQGYIQSVNGTVSLVGAHLSRWSQLPGGATSPALLRGTVLSNLDEMCEWDGEDNEQLNRMKVSDIEGDPNVAGVLDVWDEDEDHPEDFNVAMTGDFIIRIAQGTTVARGDLLMSAGDGTAKPQDDDIVRSKTIAKVTSTTVSETYSDGSYCVPCVLMAC